MATTAITANELAPALRSYAERFHAGVGRGHHAASPLGAWMLLALCAPTSRGRLREELTAVLGVDVDAAAAFVAALLDALHPAVASATGVWTSPSLHADGLSGWLARLPVSVDRGELPSQAALDRWAKEHSRGLIERFPVEISPLTLLILATALASKVSWQHPFRVVPARELGAGGAEAWAGRLKHVLRTPERHSHSQFIATTDRAGDVAVHTADSTDGLSVTSVIAEHGVPPVDVIATTYELATADAFGRAVAVRSLFDLPLGDSPLWTISEEPVMTDAPDGQEESCAAVLPAWSADAHHDLGRRDLGFPAAAASLARLAGIREYGYDAKQSVVARYGRTGFEAAATTAHMMTRGGPHQHGVRRDATLRFGHPFAVVAVTTDRLRRDSLGHYGPWHGVPVYSAWVTEPTEPDEARDEEAAGEGGDVADETPKSRWQRTSDRRRYLLNPLH